MHVVNQAFAECIQNYERALLRMHACTFAIFSNTTSQDRLLRDKRQTCVLCCSLSSAQVQNKKQAGITVTGSGSNMHPITLPTFLSHESMSP